MTKKKDNLGACKLKISMSLKKLMRTSTRSWLNVPFFFFIIQCSNCHCFGNYRRVFDLNAFKSGCPLHLNHTLTIIKLYIPHTKFLTVLCVRGCMASVTLASQEAYQNTTAGSETNLLFLFNLLNFLVYSFQLLRYKRCL